MRRRGLPLRREGAHRVGVVVPGDDLAEPCWDAVVAEVRLDGNRSLLRQRGQVSIDGARDAGERGEEGEEQFNDG